VVLLLSQEDLLWGRVLAARLQYAARFNFPLVSEDMHCAAGQHIFRFCRMQARAISIKMMPMSLVMEGCNGKSFLVNLMDCPGHVNFNDEVGWDTSSRGTVAHVHLPLPPVVQRTCSQLHDR
jgi:hypothetical protein